MYEPHRLTRRSTLKGMGAASAAALLGMGMSSVKPGAESDASQVSPRVREAIWEKVHATPFIDTHEHLIDEKDRLARKMGTVDDFSILFSMYVCNDMTVAGMPGDLHKSFFHSNADPVEKWKWLKDYWPYVKNTGYGLAVRLTIQELYGVEELSDDTIREVQAGYELVRKPGFYKYILQEKAKIESCQVNDLEEPIFRRTSMPELLMQDISIVRMFGGPDVQTLSRDAGIEVKSLDDFHRVVDRLFEMYGPYAVAVKSQDAYGRDIDYQRVAAERVEAIFRKKMNGDEVTAEEQRALSDHLFWHAVDNATRHKLPVKLHTGYYAGENSMPLARLAKNPGSACGLCGDGRETPFVFMHICYPYYEEMIALAKQWENAYIDMCWSWIINPIAAKDFLKKFVVTAPASKVFTFGGDYVPVEPVLGHAMLARRGIALALAELVEEGWIPLKDAIELTDPIMHENARRVFRLREKKTLKVTPWKV